MLKIEQAVSLRPYTSWLIGGPAEFFCLPATLDEVKEAQAFAHKNSLSITVLGGGSNVLIADPGIPGLTICLKNFNKHQLHRSSDELQIEADSGVSKSELLKIFLKEKLAPALFLAGLPGDVGGGIVMNAGVAENFRPREFVEITKWIDVLKPDGKVTRYEASALNWNYRHCHGWEPGIIVKVSLGWTLEPQLDILEKVREANRVRLSKQPLDMPSCGSVFVNPVGMKAAQLIDSCGLKGFQIGEAQVSKKHANFIVNLGSATAEDTWLVIEHVKKEVLRQKNVSLQTEVVRLGVW